MYNGEYNIHSQLYSFMYSYIILYEYNYYNYSLSKNIKGGYYTSSLYGSSSRILQRETLNRSEPSTGYGSDVGGGDTTELLLYLTKRFGPISSFSGSYRADKWSLNIIRSPGIKIYYLLHGLVRMASEH